MDNNGFLGKNKVEGLFSVFGNISENSLNKIADDFYERYQHRIRRYKGNGITSSVTPFIAPESIKSSSMGISETRINNLGQFHVLEEKISESYNLEKILSMEYNDFTKLFEEFKNSKESKDNQKIIILSCFIHSLEAQLNHFKYTNGKLKEDGIYLTNKEAIVKFDLMIEKYKFLQEFISEIYNHFKENSLDQSTTKNNGLELTNPFKNQAKTDIRSMGTHPRVGGFSAPLNTNGMVTNVEPFKSDNPHSNTKMFNDLNKRNIELQQRINSLESSLKSSISTNEHNRIVALRDQKLRELNQNNSELKGQLEEEKSNNVLLAKDLDRSIREIATLKKELQVLKESELETKTDIENHKRELQLLNLEKNRNNEAFGLKISELRAKIRESEDILSKSNEEKKQVEQKLKESLEKHEKIVASKDQEIRAQEEKIKSLSQELQESKQSNLDSETRVKSVNEELQRAKLERNQLEQRLNELSKNESSNTNEINNLNAKIEEKNSEIERLNQQKQKFEEENRRLSSENKELKGQLDGARYELSQKDNEIASLNAKVADLKRDYNQIKQEKDNLIKQNQEKISQGQQGSNKKQSSSIKEELNLFIDRNLKLIDNFHERLKGGKGNLLKKGNKKRDILGIDIIKSEFEREAGVLEGIGNREKNKEAKEQIDLFIRDKMRGFWNNIDLRLTGDNYNKETGLKFIEQFKKLVEDFRKEFNEKFVEDLQEKLNQAEISRLKKDLENKDVSIKDLESKLTGSREKLGNLEDQLKSLQGENSKKDEENKSLKQKLQAEINEKVYENNNLRAELSRINQEKDEIRGKLASELKEFAEKNAEKDKELQRVSAEKADLEKRLNQQKQKFEEENRRLSSENEKLKGQLDGARSKVSQKDVEICELGKDLNNLNRDLKQKQDELEKAREEKAKLEEQLKNLKDKDGVEAQKLREQILINNVKINELENKVKDLSAENDRLVSELEKYRNRVLDLEKQLEEANRRLKESLLGQQKTSSGIDSREERASILFDHNYEPSNNLENEDEVSIDDISSTQMGYIMKDKKINNKNHIPDNSIRFDLSSIKDENKPFKIGGDNKKSLEKSSDIFKNDSFKKMDEIDLSKDFNKNNKVYITNLVNGDEGKKKIVEDKINEIKENLQKENDGNFVFKDSKIYKKIVINNNELYKLEYENDEDLNEIQVKRTKDGKMEVIFPYVDLKKEIKKEIDNRSSSLERNTGLQLEKKPSFLNGLSSGGRARSLKNITQGNSFVDEENLRRKAPNPVGPSKGA